MPAPGFRRDAQEQKRGGKGRNWGQAGSRAAGEGKQKAGASPRPSVFSSPSWHRSAQWCHTCRSCAISTPRRPTLLGPGQCILLVCFPGSTDAQRTQPGQYDPFTRQALIKLAAASPPCPGMGVLPSTQFFTHRGLEKARKVGWGALASLGRAQGLLSLDSAPSLPGPAGWLLRCLPPPPLTSKAICTAAGLDRWKGPIVSKAQPLPLHRGWAGVKAERLTSQSASPGPAPLRDSGSIPHEEPWLPCPSLEQSLYMSETGRAAKGAACLHVIFPVYIRTFFFLKRAQILETPAWLALGAGPSFACPLFGQNAVPPRILPHLSLQPPPA